ncbi:lactonase family protein [Glaciecola sp. 1036]|uniref:lactonase family protein n=1 Tax=Alteromonadaceae TaxID=72275 RepID=UPI003D013D84
MVTRQMKQFSERKSKLALGIALAAFIAGASVTSPAEARPFFAKKKESEDRGGLVYVMTNDDTANKVMVYWRDKSGEISKMPYATVRTGGIGASSNAPVDPLGSQGSLVYSEDHNMLFGVNAGDNTVFAFKAGTVGARAVRSRLLRPKQTALVESGGNIPVSVAVSGDLLYVLNAGGTGVISTFEIDKNGDLTQISAIELGLNNATEVPFNNVFAPGQVGVDALSRRLIVANAQGQELLTTPLDNDGIPSNELTSTPTTGVVPFSFDITPFGNILVTEAGSGAVSVFESPVGHPLVQTVESVANGQAATCWIVVTDNGYAYVSNTVSDTISLYGYERSGELSLIDATAATVSPGGAPTDMILANDGSFLYTLDAGTGEISSFEVDPSTGELSLIEVETGLPAAQGIQGIAARDF